MATSPSQAASIATSLPPALPMVVMDWGEAKADFTDAVIEPRLSLQWFVKMGELAKPALEVVMDGRVKLHPQKFANTYKYWMENVRDWCISRQLWWGHQIPAWYGPDGQVFVGESEAVATAAATAHYGHAVALRRDEDVLDTWFSSALWPFSTLGWPDDTPDLKAFYPTDLLVTAPEILFFWVARMIMTGFAFMGEAPFHTVYLHGTVRDTNHVKMSKSLGNGIDPLDVVGLYGADALRYTVVAGMGLGADTILDPKDLERSFAPGRNFVTKLWNIGRFLLTNVGDEHVLSLDAIPVNDFTRADAWILGRLNAAIDACNAALGPARPTGTRWKDEERYIGLRLNEYTEAARNFVWNELADWYLESVKGRLATPGDDRNVARAVLVYAFDQALRLLHPIVPFVTEALWQKLPVHVDGTFVCTAAWPTRRSYPGRPDEFSRVIEAVSAVRQLRGEYGITPGKQLEGYVIPGAGSKGIFTGEGALIERLTRCALTVAEAAPAGGVAASGRLAGGVAAVNVQVLGSNMQFTSATDGLGNYANGLNIGPISFE